MTSKTMTKQQWVDLFQEAAVDDAMMHRWHAAFEHRWPTAHQEFLEWLKLSAPEIDRIRADSRRGVTTR